MTCSDYVLDISALLDGNLEPSRSDAVNQHLDVCADCSRFYAEQKELNLTFQTALSDLEPPPRIWQGIEAQLMFQPARRFWDFSELFRMPRLVYAGAALILLLISGLFMLDRTNQVIEEEQYLAELEAFHIEVRGNPFLNDVRAENPFINLGQAGTGNPFERLGGSKQ